MFLGLGFMVLGLYCKTCEYQAPGVCLAEGQICERQSPERDSARAGSSDPPVYVTHSYVLDHVQIHSVGKKEKIKKLEEVLGEIYVRSHPIPSTYP